MLAQYQNGDYLVTLHEDGTKVREWDSDNPVIEFPESIDLKVTDYCDLGCQYCHENSTRSGDHAIMGNILNLVNGLPAGVELAIGGGNPLAYRDNNNSIVQLLSVLSERGIICNMTVNAMHLNKDSIECINKLREWKYLHGLGISGIPDDNLFSDVYDSNTVFHIIAGVHNPTMLNMLERRTNDLCSLPLKALILGFKTYGRGMKYFSGAHTTVQKCFDAWDFGILHEISKEDRVLSFDNLALTQLEIREKIPSHVWDEKYMGDDGLFSMYVDAVSMLYAKSSTSKRNDTKGYAIPELFKLVREGV